MWYPRRCFRYARELGRSGSLAEQIGLLEGTVQLALALAMVVEIFSTQGSVFLKRLQCRYHGITDD